MAGLVPAIHVFAAAKKAVDARGKPGHDRLVRAGERAMASSANQSRIYELITEQVPTNSLGFTAPESKNLATRI